MSTAPAKDGPPGTPDPEALGGPDADALGDPGPDALGIPGPDAVGSPGSGARGHPGTGTFGLPSPEAVEARTPADRDRYVDLLRVLSIGAVVFGHWMIGVVRYEDGRITAGRLLEIAPWVQWFSWLLQVMPVFFMVGGYVNAISLERAMQAGERRTDWVRARARRLLRPIVPLLAVWVPLTAVLAATGLDTRTLELVTWVVVLPLWFLATYVAIIVLAPLTYPLHRRRPVATMVVLLATAATLDILLRFVGPERIGAFALLGWTNYLWVWAAIHQIGYFWHDRRLPQTMAGKLALAAAGYAGLVLLTQVAGYPLSMVAGPDHPTNTRPPSIALLALAAGQLGLLMAVRGPVERWLQRPRAWTAVAVSGRRIMTVYIWHMTALVALTAALVPTGIWPLQERVDASWWWLRPLWIACLAVALALLVIAFGRFERTDRPTPPPFGRLGRRTATVLGVLAVSVGITLLVRDGIYLPSGPLGLPVVDLALLMAGFVLLGVLGPAAAPAGQDGSARGRGGSRDATDSKHA